ncbi:frg1-like family [Lecanosticta acicola]|uniref:Frg1-like family n=1 Tax=Lecanosticta acicola TaxID=111012 RepID=A0AAI8VUG0_9PEZI|nr:frg1-like family [Lecanosticta acicola]
MVKPLAFKGDKKPHKKRKRTNDNANDDDTPSSKQLVSAADAAADDDENWVSADAIGDISGPVVLVLPTEPVSCVAVDQFGKVFTSKIENMVENEPRSAEPHDVRQVWVSQRIVGTENSFTFKGHHGRYLGCDQLGLLSANREAVSQEETFMCVPSSEKPGSFDIQTTRSTYISIDADRTPAEIRGDADKAGETTAVRIRMQARFKPKHKVEKAEKVRAKISRKELEDEVGRKLDDDEVKKLKKARREGNYHETMLDVKVKGKHDKFA